MSRERSFEAHLAHDHRFADRQAALSPTQPRASPARPLRKPRSARARRPRSRRSGSAVFSRPAPSRLAPPTVEVALRRHCDSALPEHEKKRNRRGGRRRAIAPRRMRSSRSGGRGWRTTRPQLRPSMTLAACKPAHRDPQQALSRFRKRRIAEAPRGGDRFMNGPDDGPRSTERRSAGCDRRPAPPADPVVDRRQTDRSSGAGRTRVDPAKARASRTQISPLMQ